MIKGAVSEKGKMTFHTGISLDILGHNWANDSSIVSSGIEPVSFHPKEQRNQQNIKPKISHTPLAK
jgi:hypothetical protein